MNTLMIYSKGRRMISALVVLFFAAILLNGFDFRIDEREYSAMIRRVTLLESHSSAYPAVLYIEIDNSQGKFFYREVIGPVLPKGTSIKIICSKRLITRGLMCEYRKNL